MSIVSNNIKYLRRLHGLTQEQFSHRIGIKRSLLGAYEESRANPNLENLMAMARTFNVSVDNLIKQDLRKIRDTPDLSLSVSTTHAATIPTPQPLVRETEPQPLANVFQQYYTPPQAPKPAPTFAGNSLPTPLPPQPSSGVPLFNNVYEAANQPAKYNIAEPVSAAQRIQYVSQAQMKTYIEQFQNQDFLNRLPVFQLPLLPDGNYRAFESGSDFLFPGAYLIGQFVRNWYDIVDGKNYVLIVRGMGTICRKIYNQVKVRGTILMISEKAEVPAMEISIKEVMEMWEIKAFFSTTLPEPSASLTNIHRMVGQLQEELERIQQ